MTRVKICGLTQPDDARLAIELGADALGFILEPASPRFIGETVPKWINELPPFPARVAVYGVVRGQVAQSAFDLVQGAEWETHPLPAPKRIHVIRLRPGQSAADLTQQTVNASAILLDAFREDAYGGTGHRVDWDIAAEIVQRAARPVILAGGLTPDNVAEAVRRVRPFMVDVSSGVEREPGLKDHGKLRDFIEAARGA